MKLYSKYFNKYKLPFLIAVFCVVCEAICDLLGPTLMSNIINTGIEQGALYKVYYWGILMLLVTAIGACFAVTRNILASKVSQRMGAELRYDLFEKIISFSEVSADKIESGSLITRMTNDTSQIVQFVNGIMRIFLKAPITCMGSIIFASILNLKLSIIIYGVVAIVGILIIGSMKFSYPRFYKLQKAMDEVNAIVQEYLIGVRLIKAFGTYDKEAEKFGNVNMNLMEKGISSQLIVTFVSPLITLTVGIGTVIVIFVGSNMFALNLANPGDITAFTIYMAQILTSLIMITNIFNTFVRTKASNARIKEVFDCEGDFSQRTKIDKRDKDNGVDKVSGFEKINGDIKFENVTFAYPNGSGMPAIKDLSFSINHGENLAIIGPTGSGKSTIAWLLLRFYDVTKGKILANGHDIRELDIERVRDNIAIVPQKPMLFSGTVSENIKWGNKEADFELFNQAIDIAQAGFIEKMQDGYESILGNAGVNVSGGQKQRISIARGILKDSSVLILDDATSALDAVTEARVREGLNSKIRNQTIITITQRCGTAMFADKILVMDNGRKVGYGTHEELMLNCEIYRDIYKTQIESSKEV
ncbi:ABC transporter ATP-binding protein [Clostridium saccharoperbutylacetonicum]|uniref:ABC-type multidrug transport system, ATPase and permease component n=1 Tax=Clostridium saccharoperbutylacetonicum N1-4(HMT) TaxID=931276 RepID=M1MXN6_9CLOT|nr:ABC transporter ATP-binding protein [Clostridium saccharoperbutylacetonicum]AGF56192.1 ABC-type multidrug transport system, ATPase and permease component [Clostridium saccharoperbutylacetonicum N1-4(HMT)]AQR94928.1 putative ABC transporter ATP-binding protein [Clostridium saccharoperbutylacetonicum]NRT63066.1 ATP-binding cassette subfamily B protein [Clostridium saccharoperbutylacetonicum]NSB26423.1 ATP-binding cassette subfamily B protein [Clostridium saccharoperbutylacetonicum]NSB30771.1 